MTIISTAKPVSLEKALDIAEERAYASKTPAFPPINDAVKAVQSIDWEDVRRRTRVGVNNCGLVIAVIGEKLHQLGVFLAEV